MNRTIASPSATIATALSLLLTCVSAATAAGPALRIENETYRLAIDPDTGAITSFFVKPLDCEMIGEPRLAANFRINLPLENDQGHYVDGMRQKAAAIDKTDTGVTVKFTDMTSGRGSFGIDLQYTVKLVGDEVLFHSRLTNRERGPVAEFWFPRLGGWTRFGPDRMARVAVPGYHGCGHGAALFQQFPGGQGLGAEAAEWSVDYPGMVMPFLSMKANGQNKALYLGYHDETYRLSTWHAYLMPTASGDPADAFLTPQQAKGEPVGLVFSHVRYPFNKDGETFDSGDFIIRLHDGDWHQAAQYYRKWFTSHWPIDKSKSWLRKQSAWFTSIIYQPEDRIVADFPTYGRWTADAQAFGINTFELIGWHHGGLERGYPDYVPEERLGGPAAFKKLIDDIHDRKGRVLAFVNYNILDSAIEDYKTTYRPWTHQDAYGSSPNWMAWGESTLLARKGLSVRRHLLSSVIPPLEKLLGEHFVNLAEAGADGLQIDKLCVSTGLDFNPLNTRKPDEALNQGLVDAIERLYAKCRAINPDFCLAGEALQDRLMPYIDVYYRAAGGFTISPLRYAFPEWTACQHIGAPRDFNGVNSAVMLGAVICVEPFTYQGSLAHPLYADLASYIAETEGIRDRLRDTIFTGDYLDMTEAEVIEVSIARKPATASSSGEGTAAPGNPAPALTDGDTISPEAATFQGIYSGAMFWRVHANMKTGRHAIVNVNSSNQDRYYTWKFTHRDVKEADLYEPFKPVRTVRAGDAVKIGPQRFHVVVEKE